MQIAKARAVFEDPHTLRLSNGESVQAKCVLIATGAAPNHRMVIPGIEYVISSNEVFYLPAQPRRILISGDGFVGPCSLLSSATRKEMS